MFVRIESRDAQGEPVDRADGSEERGEIAAIACSDDRNGRWIDLVLTDEIIIGSHDVGKTMRARHPVALFGVPGMAPQIKGEADTAQLRDLFGPNHVLIARTAPSVDEENDPKWRHRRRA